jgi:hypothetical protein
MRFRCLPPVTAAALAAAMVSALAQTAAPAASAPASVPQASKPGPRVQTPTERREGATTPGDLRPEEKVTPQIVIPLRKATPPPTKAERAAARRGTAASSAGIDDSAARCEAQVSKAAREKCSASSPQTKTPRQAR